MLSSIIEEKNSRIVEVLLSVVSPFELMAGKILGLAGIGLTVTSIWGLVAYGAARQQGFEIEIGTSLIVYFLIYYILGFVLYCALLSGVGSICNTIKESQSLMMPVMLLLVIPLIFWMPLAQDANGVAAKVLSFIPPATPMLMMLRLSSGADIWFVEIVASILLLAVSVIAAIWVSAKVFRTGVLMYGKRPSLREVARWLVAR
jgi:ABC-2 type transport system permease protein